MQIETDQLLGRERPTAFALPRVPTGVPGLDGILHGGLVGGRTTLVAGGTGCGKSVLGLQFLYSGARDGRPGVLVSFEERPAAIRENSRTFGWDLEGEEAAGRLAIIEARPNPDTVLSGRFNSHGLLSDVTRAVTAVGAERIVLDGADALLRLFEDVVDERNELFSLNEWLTDKGLTTLITAKITDEHFRGARFAFLDFMADSVISLRQCADESGAGRQLRVAKCRGSSHCSRLHAFAITDAGLLVGGTPAGDARRSDPSRS